MKLLLIIFGLILSLNIHGQSNDNWANWDKNYRLIQFGDLIKFEKEFADSVKKSGSYNHYIELSPRRYRFIAKYLGVQKLMDLETLEFVKKIFKMQRGDPAIIDKFYKRQYLFEVDGLKVWIPIQEVLEKPFKEEVRLGETVLLYCAFFTELTKEGKKMMVFTISEFMKD
jgi:hypothetical protein